MPRVSSLRKHLVFGKPSAQSSRLAGVAQQVKNGATYLFLRKRAPVTPHPKSRSLGARKTDGLKARRGLQGLL